MTSKEELVTFTDMEFVRDNFTVPFVKDEKFALINNEWVSRK